MGNSTDLGTGDHEPNDEFEHQDELDKIDQIKKDLDKVPAMFDEATTTYKKVKHINE